MSCLSWVDVYSARFGWLRVLVVLWDDVHNRDGRKRVCGGWVCYSCCGRDRPSRGCRRVILNNKARQELYFLFNSKFAERGEEGGCTVLLFPLSLWLNRGEWIRTSFASFRVFRWPRESKRGGESEDRKWDTGIPVSTRTRWGARGATLNSSTPPSGIGYEPTHAGNMENRCNSSKTAQPNWILTVAYQVTSNSLGLA